MTSSQIGLNLYTVYHNDLFLSFRTQAWVYSEVPDQIPPLEV